jgi:hypothetical protein
MSKDQISLHEKNKKKKKSEKVNEQPLDVRENYDEEEEETEEGAVSTNKA